MRLSIIIPIYNAEKYLNECIQSILCEADEETELLLINDGSKDASLQICKQYERANIRVFNNTNHGVSYSRNFGIEQARGEYILFVDSDDFLLQGWHNIVDSALKESPDIAYFIPSCGNLSKLDILDSMIGFPNCPLKNMAAVWSKIYKKTFIIQNNIKFKENIINGEDELFNIQAILCAKKYSFINNSMYYYRDNIYSATHSFNEKFVFSNDLFLIELKKTLSRFKFLTKEQIKEYIDFCLLNSLYILIIRIYAIKEKKGRKEKLSLLEREDFRSFLDNYIANSKFGKRLNKVAILLKKRKYNALFRKIQIRKAVKLIMGIVK